MKHLTKTWLQYSTASNKQEGVMNLNALPKYDTTDNPTGCCPRFDPQGWDNQELHFDNKPFVREKTRSLFHIPLNMGRVFKKTFEDMEAAGAYSDKDLIVLSHDLSPWSSEHLFSVKKEVPGHEFKSLSGDFFTKVFEGSFTEIPDWENEMNAYVKARHQETEKNYFFYTTCPKCAKVYGKNYVVAVAKIRT
jgi:hydrolase family protein